MYMMGSELLFAIQDACLGLIVHCLVQCQDEARTAQFLNKLKTKNIPQSTEEACLETPFLKDVVWNAGSLR